MHYVTTSTQVVADLKKHLMYNPQVGHARKGVIPNLMNCCNELDSTNFNLLDKSTNMNKIEYRILT